MCFGIIGLLSCSPQSDSEGYRLALSEQRPALCLTIDNEDLQGECLTGMMPHLSIEEDKTELCQSLKSEKWRGECYFQLSDGGQHIGSSAIELCSNAGAYREDCLRHAAAREVEQQIHLAELKQAQHLLPRIYSIVKNYLPDSIAQPMARDMLVRMVAAYQPQMPFNTDFCQGLTPDTCVQVYIVRSLGSAQQESQDSAWATECGTEMTPKRAGELGWALYHVDQQLVVNRAWQQVCQKFSVAE